MASITCAHCGAPINLPSDLTALEATCEFCKARTPLPPDLVKVRLNEHRELAQEQRAEQHQAEVNATVRRASSMSTWITLFSVALPIIITIAVMARVFSSIHTTTVPVPVPVPAPAPTPRHHGH
jgi:hypothetical protein